MKRFRAHIGQKGIFFMKSTESKARVFGFLLYPDSLPEDWRDKLEALGRPIAISPLHDKDRMECKSADAIRKEAERRYREYLNVHGFDTPDGYKETMIEQLTREQENGFKKAHRHGIIVVQNPVTKQAIINKLQRALGQKAINTVQIIDNIEGAYLYLTHESKDAIKKNKHIYDKKDIILLNNFDISRYITMDRDEKKMMFSKIISVTRREKFENIADLTDYMEKHGRDIGINNLDDMLTIIDGHMSVLRAFFDANYQRRKRERENTLDSRAKKIDQMWEIMLRKNNRSKTKNESPEIKQMFESPDKNKDC